MCRNIMDFITDQSGRHLLWLHNNVAVPDFVKESSVDPEDTAKLADHQFADPVHREFPIDSPSHAYLSFAYYKTAGVQNPVIFKRIETACKLHKVETQVAEIDSRLSSMRKEASVTVPKKYAIELDFGPGDPNAENPLVKQGGVHGFYPINHTAQIEDSARALGNDKEKLPLDLFVDGCRALIKAAAEKGCNMGYLPRIVRRYGTERVVDFEMLKLAAENRARMTGDPIYTEIALSAEENAGNQPVDGYVDLWKKADDINGVVPGEHIRNAFELFYSGTTKQAYDAELNGWALVAKTPVPMKELAGIKEERVRKLFPKEAAEKIIPLLKAASEKPGSELTADLSDLSIGVQKGILKLVSGMA